MATWATALSWLMWGGAIGCALAACCIVQQMERDQAFKDLFEYQWSIAIATMLLFAALLLAHLA